jgi:hypothetical protein
MAGSCERTRSCDVMAVLELRSSRCPVETNLWIDGCLAALKEQTEGTEAEVEKRKYTIE